MKRHLCCLLIGAAAIGLASLGCGTKAAGSDEGVVTLRGQVETQAERQLAVMVARDVNGVKDVVNDITVR